MQDVIVIGAGCNGDLMRGLLRACNDIRVVDGVRDTYMFFDDYMDWVVPTVNERANGKCKNPKKGRW